jgi:peptidoglycan/xylan/chitin deacetylase (PgdA/CDA1 family)
MSALPGVAGRQVNLTFHGVGPHARRIEPGEDRVWVTSERLSLILDTVAGRDGVLITFDDGNSSDVQQALPALLRRGLTATFFVVAGRIGEPGFLSEDDVRLLAAEGMTIGSHGMQHRSWRNLGDEQLEEELVVARRRLEAVVGRPVADAACPFGAYDRRVLRCLRRYGYTRVFTSDGGATRSDRWLQARNSLGKTDAPPELERMLVGDESLLRSLRGHAKSAVKRWR